MAAFDLFVSYRRRDSEQVLPLVTALEACGLTVWLDRQEINEFKAITGTIRKGLAESKAFLAGYSEDYPTSRSCQMELTAALVAAQHEGDLRQRVLVINPSQSLTHIEPVELRDAQNATVMLTSLDTAGYPALARRIFEQVSRLRGLLGGILPIALPRQFGLNFTSANHFVGRSADLWRLHSALQTAESAIISGTTASGLGVVSGLGGVGKSLLAEEYAIRFGAAYPGGLFWLCAQGHDSVRDQSPEGNETARLDQFANIATSYGIDIKEHDPNQIEAALGRQLTRHGQPFLWIVDDLAAGLNTAAVKAWLAPSPLGKTLITTRSQEYSAIGADLPLSMLNREEAFDLLCSRRKPADQDEENAARGIVGDLGNHPLAVAITAAALAAQTGLVTFAEFRANLANPGEDELELAAELTEMLPSHHEKSVAATILRSVRHLPEEGRDFLRLAALLAVAPIPPRLVVSVFQRADHLLQFEAQRRAILGQTQAENASLAERGEDGARSLHVLVSRTIGFHDVSRERSEALRRAVVASLNDLLPPVVDVRTHQGLALEVRHARWLLTSELVDADTAFLGGWVVRHDDERGLYALAQQLGLRVLEAQRRLLGDTHAHTLTSMNNLALAVSHGGDLARARALNESTLAARRHVLGDEHLDTLQSMNNLALTLLEQGDLAAARGLQESVIAAFSRALGEEHGDTLTSMHNLAGILGAQGDLVRARMLYERVLEARHRLSGDDHPNTLLTMNKYAQVLARQGDWGDARRLQERVIEVRQRILGDEHPETLTSMSDLGATLARQGLLADARGLLDRVIAVRRRLMGESHPLTLESMNDFAVTLRADGDLVGACKVLERVLRGCRDVFGERHHRTTTSAWNLFVMLLESGEEQKALGTAREHLLWLRVADPAGLTGDQISVKQQLEQMADRAHLAPS